MSFSDRYKDTDIFTAPNGQAQYAPFRLPLEFENPAGMQSYRVNRDEVGFLDLVALNSFGQEDLWWVIAWVNGMVDPEAEMFPDQVLSIPPRSAVTQFLGRK